jgi:hypothetical protein
LPEYVGVERAVAFLVKTQREDGSWKVIGTKKGADGETPTGTYWGTGWAVIGLARSLAE